MRGGFTIGDYVAWREGDFGVLDACADADGTFVDVLGVVSGMGWRWRSMERRGVATHEVRTDSMPGPVPVIQPFLP